MPDVWRRADGCPSGCPDTGHYEGCEMPEFVRFIVAAERERWQELVRMLRDENDRYRAIEENKS